MNRYNNLPKSNKAGSSSSSVLDLFLKNNLASGDYSVFDQNGSTGPDYIDVGLALQRGPSGSVYNPLYQTMYSDGITVGATNTTTPTNTLWNFDGYSDLTNVRTRSYIPLYFASAGYANMVGVDYVMHDTKNDKFWKINFYVYGTASGSMSYTRQLVEPISTTFTKTDFGSEIDVVTPDVELTRGSSQGIYNSFSEGGWSITSPVDTSWNADGWNDLSNVESRTYLSLDDLTGGSFDNYVGVEFIMQTGQSWPPPATTAFWKIKFLEWTPGASGGGFTYTREQVINAPLNGVIFGDGSAQYRAYQPVSSFSATGASGYLLKYSTSTEAVASSVYEDSTGFVGIGTSAPGTAYSGFTVKNNPGGVGLWADFLDVGGTAGFTIRKDNDIPHAVSLFSGTFGGGFSSQIMMGGTSRLLSFNGYPYPVQAIQFMLNAGDTTSGEKFVIASGNHTINTGGNLHFYGAPLSSSNSSYEYASIAGLKENSTDGALDGYLNFSTNDGTNVIERMRISSDGNLGVGINPPTARLHAVGSTNTPGTYSLKAVNSDNSQGLYVENHGATRITATATGPGSQIFTVFDTNYGNSLSVEGVYGRIGMGSVSPTNLATLTITDYGTVQRYLNFESNGTHGYIDRSSTGLTFRGFDTGTGPAGGLQFLLNSDQAYGYTGNQNLTAFFKNKVGIGTQGPDSALHIATTDLALHAATTSAHSGYGLVANTIELTSPDAWNPVALNVKLNSSAAYGIALNVTSVVSAGYFNVTDLGLALSHIGYAKGIAVQGATVQSGIEIGVSNSNRGLLIGMSNNTPASGEGSILIRRLRNDGATTVTLLDGDELGSIDFAGKIATSWGNSISQSENFASGAYIKSFIEGTPSFNGVGSTMPANLKFYTNSGTINTTPLERMVIKSNGNVGIGTAAPTAALDILGGTAGNILELNSANTQSAFYDALIVNNNGSFNSSSGVVGGGLGTFKTDHLEYKFNTAYQTYLAFTNAQGAGNKGGYGIIGGTIASADSDYRLVVINNDAGTLGSVLKVVSTATGNANDGFDYTNYLLNIGGTGTFTNIGSGTFYKIGLNVNISGGDVNYAAIFNGGNVGIGTAAPTAKLHVHSGATSSAYATIIENLSSVQLLSIQDNGYTKINGLNVGKGANQILSNTAFGVDSLSVATGIENTAIGYQALRDNTTGQTNTAIGNNALLLNTIGIQNTAIGYNSGRGGTSNNNNTSIGFYTLFNNTGDNNTAIGDRASYGNTTGAQNTSIGRFALYTNLSGQHNTAIGHNALNLNTSSGSVAIGSGAAAQSVNGNIVSIGRDSLAELTTGTQNTVLGYNTGRGIVTGSYNTVIGANITGLAAGLTGSIVIGNSNGVVSFYTNSSGNTMIGATMTEPSTKLQVQNGIISSTPGASTPLIASSGTLCHFINQGSSIGASATILNTTSGLVSTANLLVRNGDRFKGSVSGYFTGATSASKTISFVFGPNTILTTDTYSYPSPSYWTVDFTIMRNSTASQPKIDVKFITYDPVTFLSYTKMWSGPYGGYDLSLDNAIEVIGQSTGASAATGDVISNMGSIDYYPGQI